MANVHASGKRLQIDRANSTMLIMIGVAAFIVSFTAVASRALLNTRSYQARVIKEKEAAAQQLKSNLEATTFDLLGRNTDRSLNMYITNCPRRNFEHLDQRHTTGHKG